MEDTPSSIPAGSARKLALRLIYSSIALVFAGILMRVLRFFPGAGHAVIGGGIIVYIIGYSMLFWAPHNQARLRAIPSKVPLTAVIKLCIYGVYVGVITACIALFMGIYHMRQWKYLLTSGLVLLVVAFLVLSFLGNWVKRRRK